MPEPKRPLKVFLCHAHADRDPVRGLYSRLTQDGVDAWFDEENLVGGQNFELEIRQAVRAADVVIVCLSKQFNQAGFRQKEIQWALDTALEQVAGDIFIIPARLEKCDTPQSLQKWHWVDLFEDGYDMLMESLRVRAKKTGAVLRTQEDNLLSMSKACEQSFVVNEMEEGPVVPLHKPLEVSAYHINLRLAYGVAVALGLLAIALMVLYVSNLNYEVGLLFVVAAAVFFFPGVWAVATNRRWAFSVTFGTLNVAVFILAALSNTLERDVAFAIAVMMIFGVFVDFFLYQVRITKKFYMKLLWGSTGGMLFVLICNFAGFQAEECIAVYLPSVAGFLITAFVGIRFAHAMRKSYPNIFEDSLKP
jgi:hypothetical protein